MIHNYVVFSGIVCLIDIIVTKNQGALRKYAGN